MFQQSAQSKLDPETELKNKVEQLNDYKVDIESTLKLPNFKKKLILSYLYNALAAFDAKKAFIVASSLWTNSFNEIYKNYADNFDKLSFNHREKLIELVSNINENELELIALSLNSFIKDLQTNKFEKKRREFIVIIYKLLYDSLDLKAEKESGNTIVSPERLESAIYTVPVIE